MKPDPKDVSVADTLAFVTRRFKKPVSLLEVGCGSGRLAKALAAQGHAVTAIDAHADAVKAARAAGVPAVQADICAYEDEPFDGILFTRSLHHVHPLAKALERARALVKPGGWLILEEFSYTRMDRGTALWFYDAIELLVAAGRIGPEVRLHKPHPEPLERWRKWHAFDPPLHTDARMERAIAKRFRVVKTERVPYLYRYATERLERSAAGVEAARFMQEREAQHVAAGRLKAIGWRLEARG